MRRSEGDLVLSATDLSSFFECEHRTTLDLKVLAHDLEPPGKSELERRILERRGREHEARVLRFYEAEGLRVERIPGDTPGAHEGDLHAATVAAMERGAQVIYQGMLRRENWVGRPDFLVRTPTPPGGTSRFDGYIYEPVDAKLAREEKARAVLQLCVYADQLAGIQGVFPRQMWPSAGANRCSARSPEHC